MDFEKLLEPYKENGRTIAAQIKWLLKNQLPQTSIDYAISKVYKRLELGDTFPNGDALDQALRKEATAHYESDLLEAMKKRIGEIEGNLDAEWNLLTKWQKIKQVMQGKA